MNDAVLALAPYGRDAEILRGVLARHGIAVRVCARVEEICALFPESATPIVIAEEALVRQADVAALRAALLAQPAWSDVPVLLLGRSGEGEVTTPRLRAVLEHANLTLLERPLRVRVLVSAIESAIRAQKRQLELRDLVQDLEQANRVKDEFLAVVSHELRTPLNAILGWSRMLKTGSYEPSQLARGVATIERNARTQAHLIEDLLDVSRIVSGKLRLEVAPIDPREAIEHAAEAVRPAANARGVSLSVRVSEALGQVVADATRLQQIAWNLMSNAVKFTPSGGRVEVSLAREADIFELRVSDTGEGIAEDFLPYVFDRFRQRDSSTTRSHGGLGLGLAIVKHLVELHGGDARVESGGPGKGTTFVVRLHATNAAARVRPSSPPAARPSQREPAASMIVGARVLVIDDHADAREMLTQLLEAAGATARAESSVADGLAAIDTFRPTHVVADIGMPGEDGYAFVRQLRARSADRGGALPAIALTAYARAEDKKRALAEGFDAHVPKPLDMATLLAAIARATERAP